MRRFQALLPALLLGTFALVLTGCADGNLVELVSRPWAWGPCTFVLVILDVLALLQVWRSGRSDGSKVLWTALIVLFPVGGLLLYYFFG